MSRYPTSWHTVSTWCHFIPPADILCQRDVTLSHQLTYCVNVMSLYPTNWHTGSLYPFHWNIASSGCHCILPTDIKCIFNLVSEVKRKTNGLTNVSFVHLLTIPVFTRVSTISDNAFVKRGATLIISYTITVSFTSHGSLVYLPVRWLCITTSLYMITLKVRL